MNFDVKCGFILVSEVLCHGSMESRQLFNSKTQVPSRAAPREICGGQVALGQVFI